MVRLLIKKSSISITQVQACAIIISFSAFGNIHLTVYLKVSHLKRTKKIKKLHYETPCSILQ